MKKSYRIIAYFIYCLGLLLMAILPANKYEWMQEIDTEININAIQDTSGDIALFASLVLIISIVTQVILIILTRKVSEKIFNAFLIILSIFVWSKYI
jgi:hypothetical protein